MGDAKRLGLGPARHRVMSWVKRSVTARAPLAEGGHDSRNGDAEQKARNQSQTLNLKFNNGLLSSDSGAGGCHRRASGVHETTRQWQFL